MSRYAHGSETRGRARWSTAFGGENQTPICFACFELPDAIVLAIPLLPSAVVREKPGRTRHGAWRPTACLLPKKTRHPYFCPRFGLPDAIVLAIPLLPSAVVREKPGRTRHGAWRPTASLLPTDRPAKFQTKIPDTHMWIRASGFLMPSSLRSPSCPPASSERSPDPTRHGAWRPTASLLPTDRPAKFQTKIPDNRAWNDCRRLRELSPDGSGAPPPTCDTASRTPSAAKFRAVSGLLSKSA